MSRVSVITQSTIGMKVIMAVTGVLMYGWLLVHMAGNLQAFAGAEVFDGYAEMLQHNPLIWPMRLGMLGIIGAHIYSAVVLIQRSRAARPQGYKQSVYRASSLASRSMRVTGPLLALYLVFHLAHFTIGVKAIHPTFVRGAAYANLVDGLQNPLYALIYVVSVSMLGLHLHHGLWSMFQTLGLDSPRYQSLIRNGATLFTAVVVLGFVAIPISVVLGLVS